MKRFVTVWLTEKTHQNSGIKIDWKPTQWVLNGAFMWPGEKKLTWNAKRWMMSAEWDGNLQAKYFSASHSSEWEQAQKVCRGLWTGQWLPTHLTYFMQIFKQPSQACTNAVNSASAWINPLNTAGPIGGFDPANTQWMVKRCSNRQNSI